MRQKDRPSSTQSLARLSPATFQEEIKPLLRGWSHAAASVGAVAVTALMLPAATHDLPRLLSLLVFGVSLIALYVVSAIYHIGSWQGRVESALLAFDHADIFLVIAGTYTPICFNVLSSWARPAALVCIWVLAGAGIACSALTRHVPRWVLAALYLGMGWISLLILPGVADALPFEAILVLLAGGMLYTIGAVIYVFGRPNPLPRIFGFHEVFHLCVIGGSAATAAMIWIWVVPFPRS